MEPRGELKSKLIDFALEATVAVGLLCALWATRLLASLLYGVSAHDPLTYIGALILVAAVALAASAFPARRATKCDPLLALRQD